MKSRPLPWLQSFAARWSERVEQGRIPHALLLTGPSGVGKRAAAAWLVRQRLGLPGGALPEYPYEQPRHADLCWLSPPEEGHSILIDQVRELVADLALTSYAGGGKVVVIEPANAMTVSAANSLLKTLEEPPGDALLILVADRIGHLPATVVSRCQRISIPPPTEPEGLLWLESVGPGGAWAEALELAGRAPLAALARAGELDTHAAMSRDLEAVAIGQESPLPVAARWAKLEPAYVLDWLARQLTLAIERMMGGRERGAGLAVDDSVLQRMDRRNLFCYLDKISRLRGHPAGSYNVQLAFEELLLDWSEGLENVDRDAAIEAVSLLRTAG